MKVKKKGEQKKVLWYQIWIIIILGYLVQFFIREAYDVNLFLAIVVSVVFLIMGFYYWNKGFFNFLLFAAVSICMFIVIEVSFDLGFYINFLISLIVAVFFSFLYIRKKNDENYALILLYAFMLIWIINGFNVLDRTDWILENAINVPFVILLVIISKWFKFSKTSYSLFFIYMFMNIIGSHYTYSEVPFGYWLSGFMNLERNHYDRIIHFLFGFLLAYPMREIYVRVGNYKGIWALMAPVIMVLGLSCVYELVEWWIAVIFGGNLGVAYLGTQGDVWDAQKDMFNAGVGSILAMIITFVIIINVNAKAYWNELKESFRVHHKGELGEVALARMEKKKR